MERNVVKNIQKYIFTIFSFSVYDAARDEFLLFILERQPTT